MRLKSNRWVSIVFILFLGFLLSGSLACSKEAKRERHWQRGEKYFAENKFHEAIIEYQNVVQIEPTDAKARYKLGLAQLKVGQFRQAYQSFSKTAELDPG